MLQLSKVTCFPPLGQSSTVPYGQATVKFTAFIEVNSASSNQAWEIILWHNGHENREWRDLPMNEVTDGIQPLVVNSEARSLTHRRYFSVDLQRPSTQNLEHPVHFTLKYRTATGGNWKWVNEAFSFSDGQLHFQPQAIPENFEDYLENFSSKLKIQSEKSESPGAKLWSVTAPLDPAIGDDSVWTNHSLGTPRKYTRWFSLARPWTPWIAPRHGKAPFDCGNGSLICAFERHDGFHLVLLAMSGINDVLTEMKPDGKGNVIAVARNERPEDDTTFNIVAAAADSFETAMAACVYHARKLVKGYQDMDSKFETKTRDFSEKAKLEPLDYWHDGLTYCTWNSLGQRLNEQKIYDALADLRKNGIHVTNLIIDDNWQSLDDLHNPSQWDLGWSEFEANKENFPNGLQYTVQKIRKDNPNLRHVAVWHALLGYWGGLDPNGKIAKKYKTKKVPKWGGGSRIVVDTDDMDRMYDDFYSFLVKCGVTAVKTDAQYALDEIRTAPDRRRFINSVTDTWTVAALRHFDNRAISCMSMFPQNIFHTQLPMDKPRFLVRTSDDFLPESTEGHPWHVFVNALNAVFTCHLNMLPDWDMFQTGNHYGAFHAAARCISGGPVYITDYPGQHNLDVIKQMTVDTLLGQTIVLRPSTLGRSLDVYSAFGEARMLKIGSFHGGKGGISLLGLFNLTQNTIDEMVSIHDFMGIEGEEEYIIRAHSTGEISKFVSLDSQSPMVSLELPVQGFEILSAYPVRSFTLGGSTGLRSSFTKVAVLGLLDKTTGAAAVSGQDVHIQGGRLKIQCQIKGLGKLGIYISTLGDLSLKDEVIIMLQGRVIPVWSVSLNKRENVMSIDLEAARKHLDIQPGFTPEAVVEVWIQ